MCRYIYSHIIFRSVSFFAIQSHTIPCYVHILPYTVYVYVQIYIFHTVFCYVFPVHTVPHYVHCAPLLHCMCIVCNSILCSSYSFLIHCVHIPLMPPLYIVCALYVIPQYVLHYNLSSLYVIPHYVPHYILSSYIMYVYII